MPTILLFKSWAQDSMNDKIMEKIHFQRSMQRLKVKTLENVPDCEICWCVSFLEHVKYKIYEFKFVE